MVARLVSYWEGHFSGAMSNFGGGIYRFIVRRGLSSLLILGFDSSTMDIHRRLPKNNLPGCDETRLTSNHLWDHEPPNIAMFICSPNHQMTPVLTGKDLLLQGWSSFRSNRAQTGSRYIKSIVFYHLSCPSIISYISIIYPSWTHEPF